ncbi:MAG: flagellar protein export ATPase FliI [Syntrophomonadaceae bacterium]|nr:flagellar protein export ATPase FliI [Syntrophomonadaceae bacterium]
MVSLDLDRYFKLLERVDPITQKGKIAQVVGLAIESEGPQVRLGELCEIITLSGKGKLLAEVIGFKQNRTLLMPLGEMDGLGPGCEVEATGQVFKVGVGPELIGRVLDGLGNPMDGGGPLPCQTYYPVMNRPPNPLHRKRIDEPLSLGVRAIDGLLTRCKGQRMGIFAGSGVGKSTLMGMIARNTNADVNVIALIGERGREVREFLERDLGPEGQKRSVVIIATSDQPALIRLKGAFVATSIAEYFRDQGNDVMFMMDSVTRFAMAQREVGLTVGEPPATRGYTPSVFALLPKLLERSGTSDKGTITGLYSVLVDGDDMNEPIADAVRGILDGHIVLSRDLAAQNHYPAIDILNSVSRVMIEIVKEDHREVANQIRSILATYQDAKDLIDIGAYAHGSNPKIDYALTLIEGCLSFLKQEITEQVSFDTAVSDLLALFNKKIRR